jgi:hypothetical protein
LKRSKASLLAWTLFAIITVVGIFITVDNLANLPTGGNTLNVIAALFWGLLGIEFSFLAVLLITYQPRNIIGWLMMGPALMLVLSNIFTTYLEQFPTAPAVASAPLLLALWFENVDGLFLIFPIFFIMLLFPNGRLPSPRWRWLLVAGLGVAVISIFFSLFQPFFSSVENSHWILANPIGFLPADTGFLGTLLTAVLVVLTLSYLAAPFVRFRSASGVERNQIKWLFYACGLFILTFAAVVIIPEDTEATILLGLLELLFPLSIMTIPAAIAVAILRYRLYDIDVIIRKTLLYGALTGLLALIYFGSVVLLQALFETLTDQSSPIIIVISTLLIAALFAPLRRSLQRAIDRRFFRQKYDAQRVLAAFAETARDEVELETLTAELLRVTRETVQPESVTIWLRERQS